MRFGIKVIFGTKPKGEYLVDIHKIENVYTPEDGRILLNMESGNQIPVSSNDKVFVRNDLQIDFKEVDMEHFKEFLEKI